MEKAKFASIIVTHYGMDQERSNLMKSSISSLLENTMYPFELIVIDNGPDIEDTKHLSTLAAIGQITTYIRNSNNMHFGWARNQGLSVAQGDYIVIADNDIFYKRDWLTQCVRVLEAFPDKKIYSTPVGYPTPGMNSRYHQGYLEYDGWKYELNMRAGSNCFVVRREDFKEIGPFLLHRIAGSVWTDNAVRAGYLACVVPGNYIEDMGLRRGYNLKETLPVRLNVRRMPQGILYNQDNHQKNHPDHDYRDNKFFDFHV